MRMLIAALEHLRARLNKVIDLLERGDQTKATEELEAMQDEFRETMQELRKK